MISEQLLQLNTLVLCDAAPAAFDAVYLFAETADNAPSGLRRAIEWLKTVDVPIALCGGTGFGYTGFEDWKAFLVSGGVPSERVVPIPPQESLNTNTESFQLVAEAKQRGWKSVVIVAPPFHQLRAFINVVSVAQRMYPELKIYNQPGVPLDWNAHVIHHQGIHTDIRKNFVLSELERIARYHEKGDLVDAETALEYLAQRDM